MINIAISGFGRIGRTFLRTILFDKTALEKINVAAINIGPADPNYVAHMFKYDTIMGTFNENVFYKNNILNINEKQIKIISETDPSKINWKSNNVDLVVECSGKFTDGKLASQHLKSGANFVLISAPAINEDITIIPGVNDKDFDKNKHKIISLGSCTTNALLPILKLINDEFTITSGYMNTIHAYTNSQVLLDVEKKDLRRSRAAALNIIPTTTGAIKVVHKLIPALKDIFDGCSIRVPVGIVSFIDISFTAKKEISNDLIINLIKDAKKNYLKDIIDITSSPLVSSDFKENPHSIIIDELLTKKSGNIGKIFGWYDNEWGYSCRLKDFVKNINN